MSPFKSHAKARHAEPQSKPPKSTDYTFINFSEPSQSQDQDLKKFIRSNAMRKYRQKAKQKAIALHRRVPLQEVKSNRSTPRSSEREVESRESDYELAVQDAWTGWPQQWKESLSEAKVMFRDEFQPHDGSESDNEMEVPIATKKPKLWIARQSLASNLKEIPRGGLECNMFPIGGCPRYNSKILQHCTCGNCLIRPVIFPIVGTKICT